jgi:hypothetical protein
MKLDLVLCLVTAAYAAPIPGVVERAVAEVRDATQKAPGLFERVRNLFTGRNVRAAHELNEEFTGGPHVEGLKRPAGNLVNAAADAVDSADTKIVVTQLNEGVRSYGPKQALLDSAEDVAERRKIAAETTREKSELLRRKIANLETSYEQSKEETAQLLKEKKELDRMRHRVIHDNEIWNKWKELYRAKNPGASRNIMEVRKFALREYERAIWKQSHIETRLIKHRQQSSVPEGVKDATQSAPGVFRRLGNWFTKKHEANAARSLLERKAANRAESLPVLTDKEKEGLKHLQLSWKINKIQDELKMLRKKKNKAFGENDDQEWAEELLSKWTKRYRESQGMTQEQDVPIYKVIQFAQTKADVLKNRLTKVKKLSYAMSLDVALYYQNHGTRDLKKAKSNVAELEARLKAIDKDTDKKSWDTISTALENAKGTVEYYELAIPYWKKFLDEKSVKAAKNILNSVEIALNAVTNSEKQLATWKKEVDELNGMTNVDTKSTVWSKWSEMYRKQKKENVASLADVKSFAQGKISSVEERLIREREILQKAKRSELARSEQETEKLKNIATPAGIKSKAMQAETARLSKEMQQRHMLADRVVTVGTVAAAGAAVVAVGAVGPNPNEAFDEPVQSPSNPAKNPSGNP